MQFAHAGYAAQGLRQFRIAVELARVEYVAHMFHHLRFTADILRRSRGGGRRGLRHAIGATEAEQNLPVPRPAPQPALLLLG